MYIKKWHPEAAHEFPRKRSRTKDLAHPSCQTLDTHPLHNSAQAEVTSDFPYPFV